MSVSSAQDLSPDQIKQQMCDIGRRIWQRGYCSGNEGNHTVRIADDRVLCTPSGISKGSIEPAMILTVDMDGKSIDADHAYPVTSEIQVHLAVFRCRPDVKAVVHSHPTHAGAFAVAKVPLPEGIHPEAEVLLGRVPMVEYIMPGTRALADAVGAAINHCTTTVLMAHHGTVSFSARDLTDAYYRLEVLDAYCKILLNMTQLGKVSLLSDAQMVEILQMKIDVFGFPDDRLVDGRVQFGEHNDAFLEAFNLRRERG